MRPAPQLRQEAVEGRDHVWVSLPEHLVAELPVQSWEPQDGGKPPSRPRSRSAGRCRLTRAPRIVHTSFSANTALSFDQPSIVATWQRAGRQIWGDRGAQVGSWGSRVWKGHGGAQIGGETAGRPVPAGRVEDSGDPEGPWS